MFTSEIIYRINDSPLFHRDLLLCERHQYLRWLILKALACCQILYHDISVLYYTCLVTNKILFNLTPLFPCQKSHKSTFLHPIHFSSIPPFLCPINLSVPPPKVLTIPPFLSQNSPVNSPVSLPNQFLRSSAHTKSHLLPRSSDPSISPFLDPNSHQFLRSSAPSIPPFLHRKSHQFLRFSAQSPINSSVLPP